MQAVLFALVLATLAGVVLRVLGEARRRDRIDAARQSVLNLAAARAESTVDREGGSPLRPMTFSSPAAIEPRAEREACPFCGNPRHVDVHSVTGQGVHRVRVVQLRCGTCGRESRFYARVEPAAAMN
jgi:hypothetical protein